MNKATAQAPALTEKPKTVEELLAEQGVALPEKGKYAPQTLTESLEPHHNEWQAKAMAKFKGYWCERVVIRGSSCDYDYQKVDESMSKGRVILYNPEAAASRKGRVTGDEYFECVGHPNYCLMGIPLEDYARERQRLHALTNKPLDPGPPSDISTPFEKRLETLDKQSADQYFADR